MAETLCIHPSDNCQNSQHDYGLSACGFMNCMTPALSSGASSISSRRGSMMSFSSSYSTSTSSPEYSSPEYTSPATPTPISREYQVEGLPIKSHNLDYLASAQSYARRPMTPPNSTHSSLEDAFDPQAPYLCAGSSVGENFGCGALESSFIDLSTGWECQIFDQDASPAPSTPMESQEGYLLLSSLNPHSASQVAGDIRQEFPAMNDAYPNPPPTVLPSQTLKCPNPPESTLATPFVSPVKTPAQLSPYSSPYLNEDPNCLKFEFAEPPSPCATLGSATATCDVLSCEDPALRMQRRQIVASYKRIASRKSMLQVSDCGDEDPGLVKISLARESVKKQYPCNICAKGFDRHEHLTRHNRTTVHINKCIEKGIEPPEPRPTLHKCPHCDKEFNRHDNLKPHKRTHYHDNEANNKNPSVSVEESEAMGEGKNDPRLNPNLGAKKGPNKKARTKKRL